MQRDFKISGASILGNDITITASKDWESFGSFKQCYWATVYIEMNGHEMNIEDLREDNIELIIDQLPYL